MRVLYFLNCFPTISETFVFNEIKEFIRRGVKVDVISFYAPDNVNVHQDLDGIVSNVVYLNHSSPIMKLVNNIIFILTNPILTIRFLNNGKKFGGFYSWLARNNIYLLRLVKALSPTHIHCHFAGTNTQCAMLVGETLNIPFSFTAHGYDIYFNPPENYPLLIANSSSCITVSKANSDYLIKQYGVIANKFNIIASGIDLSFFKKQTFIKSKVASIITVARLEPVKGLQYAIEAAFLLKQSNVDFFWTIVGDGRERESLQKLINAKNLNSHVFLVGSKSSCEIKELLDVHQFFVLSSLSEGFPVVLMEALAMELIVIATNVGGVGELIKNKLTGFLVDSESASAITETIIYCLNNLSESEKYAIYGRQFVSQNYSISKQIDCLLPLFGVADNVDL